MEFTNLSNIPSGNQDVVEFLMSEYPTAALDKGSLCTIYSGMGAIEEHHPTWIWAIRCRAATIFYLLFEHFGLSAEEGKESIRMHLDAYENSRDFEIYDEWMNSKPSFKSASNI